MRSDNYKNKKTIQPCEYVGHFVTLIVKRFCEHGVYLGNDNKKDEADILLPAKEQPVGLSKNDELRVFIYRDSEDRPIATLTTPLVTIDKTAVLKVAEKTKIGAFLDWGLPKQLLLPFHEMTGRLEKGDECLVTLYVDKSERLCATQKHIYSLLSTASPYQGGEVVNARVYEFSKNFGTFVAIEDKYSGMIPAKEDTRDLHIGSVIPVTIVRVKEDGKLDVTRRKHAYEEIDSDAERVFELILQYGGVLPFSDHADPERISKETGLSKAAFKRAVGKLYKERRIEIKENSIELTKKIE